MPRGFGGLTAVERIVLGDALGPALDAVAAHDDQEELAIVRTAEAGFEMPNQWQAQQTKLDAVDGHEQGRIAR